VLDDVVQPPVLAAGARVTSGYGPGYSQWPITPTLMANTETSITQTAEVSSRDMPKAHVVLATVGLNSYRQGRPPAHP
jgi:hypothetical protein